MKSLSHKSLGFASFMNFMLYLGMATATKTTVKLSSLYSIMIDMHYRHLLHNCKIHQKTCWHGNQGLMKPWNPCHINRWNLLVLWIYAILRHGYGYYNHCKLSSLYTVMVDIHNTHLLHNCKIHQKTCCHGNQGLMKPWNPCHINRWDLLFLWMLCYI